MLTKEQLHFDDEHKKKIIHLVDKINVIEPNVVELTQLLKRLFLDEQVKIVKLDSEDNPNDHFLTVEETAQLFGVTPQAVYKWIQKDKIKYIQTSPVVGGRGYMIPKDQFHDKLISMDYIDSARKKLLKGATDTELIDKRNVKDVGEDG